MDNLRKFIKTKKQNRVYRYSIRRLSIGVVSCVVGAFVLFSPVKFGNAELSGVVYASEVENKNKAEKLKEELNKKREAFEEEVESLRAAYLGADASVKSKFFKTVAQLTSKLDEVDKKIKALNNYDTSEEQLKSLKIEIEKVDNEINDFSVEFAKARLAKKINNLGYLSDKEKEAFISGVNTSTTINSVNIAFELAVEKDKANEIELKEKAKKEIEKLKTITDKSKNLAKKLIDKAKDKAEVEKIVAESKGLEDRKLNDLKEKAKKEIDELKEITDKSKNLAKKLIDKAKDKEEIGKIVDEAKRLEDRKQKEKPEQIKYTLKIKEIDKDGNVISLLKTVEDLTAEKLNEETEKFVDGADYKDETGNYKVVGTVEMDGTTAVVKVIEVKPEKTKYTLKIKEVDKDGNVISLLKTVEDLTAEKLNEETEKFVDGADYKDETGNYKVVGTVEMDGTTAVVKVIEVKPEKTKYTLKIKEVDKDGNVISLLKTVEDLTAEKLNEETEKFVDGADYKDETGNYKVVGTVEMDGTTAVVKVIEVFTVTFDSNGGSQVAPVVAEKGKEVTKPEDPTREGFKFERWELEGKEYDFNSPVEKNITLKAVWSMKATPIEPIEMVTVTFDSNGGTPVAAKEVQKGKAVAKPEEPKAEGLTFERWELEGKEYDFTNPVEKNITLKAVWSMKATPLVPGIKKIPAEKIRPIAFRNDNDQMGSIDWRYIKAPSKDTKTEVQKQKTVIEVKVTIGSDILQRTINNHTQEIKMDTPAFIKDGRTMLPIRYVAEALGYTVEWREDTRTAILKDKNTTIEIPVDTNKIIVNGKEIQSDVKPMIENGRTMLPIANVARALGLKDGQDIKWDEAKQEVTIRKEIIN